jgi:hypothetical protein
MRGYSRLFILGIALLLVSCSSAPKPSSPLETLKAYGNAYKKKDFTTMKLLLSDESIKMAEQEAKAQGVTLDEIVRRETLFNNEQKTAEFRNARTEDDRATIEMKDSMGMWNTVHFIREEGIWKIDKKGLADQLIRENEEENRRMDENINAGRQQ